jgi:hypothetical protein
MTHLPLFSLIVAFSLMALTARAAVYHVDTRHPDAADTNLGSHDKPFRTISHAAEVVVPGDQVLIHTGVYREEVRIKASGTAEQPILFAAAPAARVEITGADVLEGLTKEPGPDEIYSAPWPHRFITWNQSGTHPDDAYHALIGRSEQVIVGDYLLRQVLERPQLARGTFYVDLDAKRIYVWDAAGRKLANEWGAPLTEASVRTAVWLVDGQYVQTRGLRFRHAANMAQHGALKLSGAHDVMEDCVIEEMNSAGATFEGSGIIVRRCTFRDNGQIGFGASHAHNLLLTDCLIENNGTKGWNRGWEAGGNKLALSRGVVLERSRFLRNRGNGIWFDIGNEDCTVRNCLIADNEDAGIFYEISYGLHAHDNVIVGNGFLHDPGAWGANGGISTSSSPDCVIERNLLLANREGFQFREAPRSTPLIGKEKDGEVPVWNHDTVIRANLLAYNRDVQIGGWFDTPTMPHWPRAMQAEAKASLAAKPPADIAAAYKAAEDAGKPADLALEGLNLRLEGNHFATADGQQLCQWGPTWGFHRVWPTLEETAAALPIFSRNTQVPVVFAEPAKMDLRIRGDSAAAKSGCYPQGEVPGVTLGILP